MLVTIGLMIGLYTSIRLLSLVTRSGEREEHVSIQALAFIGFIVILCLCGLLWKQSSDAGEQIAKSQAELMRLR